MKILVFFSAVVMSLLLLLSSMFCLVSHAVLAAETSTGDKQKLLRIAVFTLEESGHLLPMSSIVHAAVRAGHSVDIFISPHGAKSTRRAWPGERVQFAPILGTEHFRGDHPDNFTMYQRVTAASTLEGLALVEEMAHGFFHEMVQPLMRAIAKQYSADGSLRPDVILSDFAYNNLAVAMHAACPALRGVPLVFLWPLTLSLPTATSSLIPAFGSGLTLKAVSESIVTRLMNRLHQKILHVGMRASSKLDSLLAAAGAPSSQQLGYDSVHQIFTNHFLITPSVFGLDLGQPLCPNVRPVGFLNPPEDSAVGSGSVDSIPSAWKEWLEFCSSGVKSAGRRQNVLYVNMGSVAVLPEAWVLGMEQVMRHLADEEGICVVWKMRLTEQVKLAEPPAAAVAAVQAGAGEAVASGVFNEDNEDQKKRKEDSLTTATMNPAQGERLAIVSRVPFAPRTLMNTGKIAAFVTHCGDTSVYEAVQALTPFVGVAMFADQPDMCARIVDAGVGVALDKRQLAEAAQVGKTSSNNDNDGEEATRIITSSALYKAIKEVMADRELGDERAASMVSKLRYITAVGESMGGPEEALRVLELATMHNGTTSKHFSCAVTRLSSWERDGDDIAIALGAGVVLLWLIAKKCSDMTMAFFGKIKSLFAHTKAKQE